MKRLGWTLGLGIPAGLAAWIAAGSFLPLVDDSWHPEYVFLSASYVWLALCVTVALGAVAALGSNQRRFAPAVLIASLDPLALLALVPPFAPLAGPLVFVGIDLRRWRIAAAVLLALVEIDRARGWRWRTRAAEWWGTLQPRTRLLALDASIFVFAAAYATWTSPIMRFTPNLHGDEPKYIRYCENLYQGNGFDITDIKPAATLQRDAPSHVLVNVEYIFETIRLELRRAERDIRSYRHDPDFVFNRGKFVQGWFVYSKTGRIFQVHTPGVSLLAMPFYYLDRKVIAVDGTTYMGQFAGGLWATNAFFLGMYALWGVVIFRFVRYTVGSDVIAWLLAMLAVATMPITAFAFQMYPETTAGVFITAVCGYLAFSHRRSPWAAALFGAMAAYLPWLHVRFVADAGLLLIWALVVFRRERRLAAAFAAGWVLVMAALSLHAFHVTGSILPTALYDTEGVPQVLSPGRVAEGLIGFAFDRGYGLLAYSPYFALALLGIWSFARREPLTSLFMLALFFAAAIPSAAHSWTAAGGSPLRHIVALMPLWLLPLAEALRRFARRRAFIVAFAVCALLSLQNAVAYNNFHFKAYGPMVDESVSGWKINLLFPSLNDHDPTYPRSAARYLPPPRASRSAVATALARGGCTICVSSVRGRLAPADVAALKPVAER